MEINSAERMEDKSFTCAKCQETGPSGCLGWGIETRKRGSIERLGEGKSSILTLHPIVSSEYFAIRIYYLFQTCKKLFMKFILYAFIKYFLILSSMTFCTY